MALDEPIRRRLAATAFAMGISARRIEDLIRGLAPDDGPDHSTIDRWIADEAEEDQGVLKPLDAACVPEVRTPAVDEILLEAVPLWSASSRHA